MDGGYQDTATMIVGSFLKSKMIEIKDNTYKGTRILLGNEKRELINKMISKLTQAGYTEISIPIIQYQEMFKNKVGEENQNMIFEFKDRGNRDLCLAPEYTAVIQQLAKKYFKNGKNLKLFYIQECFRGEKPQAGRYRQFTQLGIEYINPSPPEYVLSYLESLALDLVSDYKTNLNRDVKRGLDYYKDGKGFEIECPELGAQKQVCGGGEYEGGVGFAIGIDRLLLASPK